MSLYRRIVAEQHNRPTSPAGLWVRSLAFVLDYVPILGYMGLLAATGGPLSRGWLRRQFEAAGPLGRDALAFATLVFPVLLYFAIGDASGRQGTWGKQRMGLRVQTIGGEHIGFRRSLLRSALKLLPWQISHTTLFHLPGFPTDARPAPATYAGFGLVYALIGANLLAAWRTRRGQALYDQVAGTAVVKQ